MLRIVVAAELDLNVAAALIAHLSKRVEALESPDATIDRLEAQIPNMTPAQREKLHQALERAASKLAEQAAKLK